MIRLSNLIYKRQIETVKSYDITIFIHLLLLQKRAERELAARPQNCTSKLPGTPAKEVYDDNIIDKLEW